MKQLLFFLSFLSVIICLLASETSNETIKSTMHVMTGLDAVVTSNFAELKGKRVGVITNHTGLTKGGRHIADLIHQADNVTLAALFGPEHGIRGAVKGGVKIETNIDSSTGVPVFSLYGDTRKPTEYMLDNLDVLIFDIQDVGARFYTYVYTMALAMESAAQYNKEFIVLDRPNPLTGIHVEGPLLREGFESFVGMFPIPVRHGMTVGELALMFKGQGWIKNARALDLKVIQLRGWKRSAWLDETDVPWVAPSPNMRTLQTAVVYPGICFLEGTNLSEGRGTVKPFEQLGAPWIDGQKLAQSLSQYNLPGLNIDAVTFTPTASKFNGENCNGIFLDIIDRDLYKPVQTGIAIIGTIKELYPQQFNWSRTIDRLYGSDLLRKGVDEGKDVETLIRDTDQGMRDFLEMREKYLLYP